MEDAQPRYEGTGDGVVGVKAPLSQCGVAGERESQTLLCVQRPAEVIVPGKESHIHVNLSWCRIPKDVAVTERQPTLFPATRNCSTFFLLHI